MKKIFISMAFVAAMFAAASCACSNNQKEEACTPEECAKCEKSADCDQKAECCPEECKDSTQCQACDSTAVDCAQKAE